MSCEHLLKRLKNLVYDGQRYLGAIHIADAERLFAVDLARDSNPEEARKRFLKCIEKMVKDGEVVKVGETLVVVNIARALGEKIREAIKEKTLKLESNKAEQERNRAVTNALEEIRKVWSEGPPEITNYCQEFWHQIMKKYRARTIELQNEEENLKKDIKRFEEVLKASYKEV